MALLHILQNQKCSPWAVGPIASVARGCTEKNIGAKLTGKVVIAPQAQCTPEAEEIVQF